MDGALTVLIDERALVARATVEPAAFAAIYDHYFPRIYAYVRYRTPDRATADDLTATIFTRALERLAAYDGAQGPFAPWLFTIARNAVSDYLRAGRRRRWLPLDRLRDQAGDDPPPDEVAAHARAPRRAPRRGGRAERAGARPDRPQVRGRADQPAHRGADRAERK